MKTEAADKRSFISDPQIRRFKNKAGVLEQRVVACVECGEDFCNGKLRTIIRIILLKLIIIVVIKIIIVTIILIMTTVF